MANVNSILTQRVKNSPHTSKMRAMAKQSATGNLTSFSGVFSVEELSDKEKASIEDLLKEYGQEKGNIQADLQLLISLTSEVKAINNQAALLHGERIKKAQQILKRYRDGAFTAWLLAAYGNRQTPYNLMQYYEFYETMPKSLKSQMESMPRQAVYVLASRNGSIEKKQTIVENYQGETKAEVLTLIRQTFPLDYKDRRKEKVGQGIIQNLERLYTQIKQAPVELNASQREHVQTLLYRIQQLVG